LEFLRNAWNATKLESETMDGWYNPIRDKRRDWTGQPTGSDCVAISIAKAGPFSVRSLPFVVLYQIVPTVHCLKTPTWSGSVRKFLSGSRPRWHHQTLGRLEQFDTDNERS